jgi:hypothetical protein
MLMKHDKTIKKKTRIQFGNTKVWYVLIWKIKKIFKKLLANPKIQGLVFDYALTCQFNQFLQFFLRFPPIFFNIDQQEQHLSLFMFFFLLWAEMKKYRR